MTKTISMELEGWKAWALLSFTLWGFINAVVQIVYVGMMLATKVPSVWDKVPSHLA